MFDLLSPIPTHEQSGNISIQEDPNGQIRVKGLSLNICANEEDALNFLFEGDTNRTISEHRLNRNSSRSHCIFTVHVESKSRVESSEKVVISKLHLVDLAGSERTKKTNSEGITLKEAQFINKSLSFLEQVVVAVSDRNRSHIPYRQSKLTNLLKDSIGGNCKTLMIANVWPEPSHIEETISTFKFATRMMKVTNKAQKNIHQDPTMLIKRYEREIRDLKQELAMHDTLANRGRINYDQYTPDQQYEIQQEAQKFLDGELEDIDDISSLRQVRELFYQMRMIYRKTVQNARVLQSRHGSSAGDGQLDDEANAAELARKKTMMKEGGVGDEEEGGGFGVGMAPRESKPSNQIEKEGGAKLDDPEAEAERIAQEEAALDQDEDQKSDIGPKTTKKIIREYIPRGQAFGEFKIEEGKTFEDNIRSNKTELKGKKDEFKTLKEQCNKAKGEIDSLKNKLDHKNDEKQKSLELDEEEDVIDEEEYNLIREMKDFKKAYRTSYDKLKGVKGDIFLIQQNIDQLKQSLVTAFEVWYEDTFDTTAEKEANVSHSN